MVGKRNEKAQKSQREEKKVVGREGEGEAVEGGGGGVGSTTAGLTCSRCEGTMEVPSEPQYVPGCELSMFRYGFTL